MLLLPGEGSHFLTKSIKGGPGDFTFMLIGIPSKKWRRYIDDIFSLWDGDKKRRGSIDLFRLYILFSQYKSCDNTQEVRSFLLFIKKSACGHIHACMHSF